MAQNCTDYSVCFEKRLDTNGDTIVDVLLIDPPDSILRLNVKTIIDGKAFNGSVFNLNPRLDERGYTVEYVDQVPPIQTGNDEIKIAPVYHPGDPILYTQDTVVLYSIVKKENGLVLDGCAGLQPGLYMLYVETSQANRWLQELPRCKFYCL